jgi:hypothetical protein
MLSTETIKLLKQVNISKNADKTKERIRAVWKPLEKSKRAEILETSGLKQVTVERAYTNGTVQAKLVVAFSQVLGIDPLYITGRSDTQRPYDEANLIEFLGELGYNNLKKATGPAPAPAKVKAADAKKAPAEKPAAKRAGRTPKAKAAAVKEEPAEVIIEAEAECVEEAEPCCVWEKLAGISEAIYKDLTPSEKKRIAELDDDDYLLLLQGMFMQADFNKNKENLLALVKYILLY